MPSPSAAAASNVSPSTRSGTSSSSSSSPAPAAAAAPGDCLENCSASRLRLSMLSAPERPTPPEPIRRRQLSSLRGKKGFTCREVGGLTELVDDPGQQVLELCRQKGTRPSDEPRMKKKKKTREKRKSTPCNLNASKGWMTMRETQQEDREEERERLLFVWGEPLTTQVLAGIEACTVRRTQLTTRFVS